MPIVLKSGSLNLLEPSRPVQACNGISLHFYNNYKNNNSCFQLRRIFSGLFYNEMGILFLYVFTPSVVLSLSTAFCFPSCMSFVPKSGFVLKAWASLEFSSFWLKQKVHDSSVVFVRFPLSVICDTRSFFCFMLRLIYCFLAM